MPQFFRQRLRLLLDHHGDVLEHVHLDVGAQRPTLDLAGVAHVRQQAFHSPRVGANRLDKLFLHVVQFAHAAHHVAVAANAGHRRAQLVDGVRNEKRLLFEERFLIHRHG